MKSYMISLLVIGIALGGLGLGTFAYFTDSHTLNNNVIKTGDADIWAWTAVDNDTQTIGDGSALKCEELAPGEYKTMGYIILQNQGTTDLKWRVYLDDQSTNLPSLDNLLFKFTLNPDEWTGYEPSGHEWNGGAGELLVTKDSNGNGIWTWAEVSTPSTNLNAIELPAQPGYWQVFRVEVGLRNTAGNDCQNKYVNLKAIVDATQFSNPGWDE